MRRVIVFLLVLVGAFFGIVWYFDVESTGGSWGDFFSDPIGGTTSLFSRFGLWFISLGERFKGATGVGTVDPVALASGLIAGFEGFSPKAYPDPSGQTTTYSIGYGHQIVSGDGFDTTSTISESDALALLQQDLANYVACVNNAVTVPVTPQQQAALYSLCYNIGCNAFQNSTLLGDLNVPDYQQAQVDFASWNMAGGQVSSALTNRRASEANLFGSSAPSATPDSSGDTQVADASQTTDDSEDTGDDSGDNSTGG